MTAAGTERTESAAGCVVALPAQLATEVVPDLDAWRREYMGRVRRGRLLLAHVGLSTAPPGIGATYTMIPRAEHPFLGGIVCDHNKAPGRAPEGKGLLTLALSNPWCERHWTDDDESLVTASMEALEQFMPGSRAMPSSSSSAAGASNTSRLATTRAWPSSTHAREHTTRRFSSPASTSPPRICLPRRPRARAPPPPWPRR